jgi:carboxyl-terminal processing protease
VLGASPRGLRVVRVPTDSPAAKAGLLEGDFIVAIDDRSIAGLSGKQLHELLTGEVGSPVRLRVTRDGSEHEIAVTRAPYDTRDRYGK